MGLQITKNNYDRWAWQQRAATDFPFRNSKYQTARDLMQVRRINFKNYSEQDKKRDWILMPRYIIAYHLHCVHTSTLTWFGLDWIGQ